MAVSVYATNEFIAALNDDCPTVTESIAYNTAPVSYIIPF